MKPAYLIFGVVGLAVVVWWAVFVRQETEPITPNYDSPSMIFEQKKATADLHFQVALQDGNYAPAIAAYKDAISVRPENSLALNDLGSCYYEQGRHEMAPPVVEDLRVGDASLEEDLRGYSPKTSDTIEYISRKLAGSPSGRYVWDVKADVIEPLRRFLDQDYPDRASLSVHTVKDYRTVTILVPPRLEEVKERIRGVVGDTESGKFTWLVDEKVAGGVQDFLKAEYPQALIYENALGRDSEIVLVTGSTAASFVQAEVYFWAALNAKSEYARPYRNLGALYVQLGRRAYAIDLFEQALQLEPHDQELKTYLEQLAGY